MKLTLSKKQTQMNSPIPIRPFSALIACGLAVTTSSSPAQQASRSEASSRPPVVEEIFPGDDPAGDNSDAPSARQKTADSSRPARSMDSKHGSDKPRMAAREADARPGSEVTPDPSEPITDQRIELAIDDELWGAKGVNANHITVTVSDGVATLSGKVRHLLSKESAIRIAKMTRGVRAVIDDIRVQPKERPDNEIRTDVLMALARDPATETWDIQALVTDGAVTLKGTAQSFAEKQLAGKVAKSVRGVTGLQNLITLREAAERTDYEIENEIEARLEWDRRLDDELINVSVRDGKVTLAGTVGSAYEKTLAYGDAWVNGVSVVDDEDVVVAPWSRDAMQRSPSQRDRSDEKIRQALKDALLYDPRVDSFNPRVSVSDGNVTITGVVDNLKAKRAAEQNAQNTVGVERVRNYLKVQPNTERSDETMEKAIADAFLRDPIVNRFEINANVVDGEVYLYGNVDSHYEKSQAEDIAAKVYGVTDVNNYLSVSYDVNPAFTDVPDWDPTLYDYDFDYQTRRFKSDGDIKEDVEGQLFWSPRVDETQVAVRVDDGNVTLTGTVDSQAERRKAEENAIEGGAVSVNNDLQVR
jgi:osmotically-inducible protein OsmY